MLSSSLRDDYIDDIIEKPISKAKSAEELRCHTIDENLSDFSKCTILLSSNLEAQILVGIRMIPHLLSNDKQQCIHKVFPHFKEYCFLMDVNRAIEFHQTLNKALIEILSEQLLAPKEFSNHFIQLITNKINLYCDKPIDYENSTIYQYWIDLMFEIIDFLPESIVKSSIFDSVPYSKLQQLSRRSREYLCFLLAKCASKLNHQIVRAQLYPILSDLCNDTEYEVRAIACKALAPVCTVLGSELSNDLVLPEIFKYLCDESTLVKTACFLSLVDILTLFNNYETKSYLLKKIQSFFEYGLSLRDENYLLVISKCFGAIVAAFNDIMNTQTKLYFVDVFYQLCKNESLFAKRSANESRFNWISCKINLANGFANLLLVTNSINFENKLSQCLTALIRDKNEHVRATTISNIIEIAQKLGPSQYHLIINDYSGSLTDESMFVLQTIVNQLDKFLQLFIKKDSNGILTETQQMPGFQLVLKRIIQLESTLSQSYKYSIHAQVLDSFALLPYLISTENLIEKVLPILEQRIHARALPVRKSAIKSTLLVLRKIPLQKVRNNCMNKLLAFSLDKNCYKRACFIEMCKTVMELYSKSFFKNTFYQSLIELANDPVVNVRICFTRLLADLKKMWKIQHDRDKLEKLEQIAKKLLHDKDKDVYELAQKAILQMDSIGLLSRNESEEKFNKKKEDEEAYLLEIEPKKIRTSQNQNNKTPKPLVKSHRASLNMNKGQIQNQLQTLSDSSNTNQSNNGNSYQNQSGINNKLFQSVDLKSPTLNLIEKKSLKPRRNSVNVEILSASSQNSIASNGRTFIKKK